jgi:hypothetical protein
VCIDLFLRNRNEAISDVLADLLRTCTCEPSPAQRQRFEDVLFGAREDTRVDAMLALAPRFVLRPREVFRRFDRFAAFVDRTDSNVLLSLSALALEFHAQLFAGVAQGEMSHWRVALRMVSDENAAVRCNCCHALTPHLCAERPNLERCEYDLIVRIYEVLAEAAPNTLVELLAELKRVKEGGGEAENGEIAPFLFPPSFHIGCIKKLIAREKS